MIRVLLADDHSIVRDGLRRIVEEDGVGAGGSLLSTDLDGQATSDQASGGAPPGSTP